MHVATLMASQTTFQCLVEEGKETVHPQSPHFIEGCIADERVPTEMIVVCRPSGAVTCMSERSVPVGPGDRTIENIKITRQGQTWMLVPSAEGKVKSNWFQNLVRIEAISKSHAQHIIDLLERNPDSALGEGKPLFV